MAKVGYPVEAKETQARAAGTFLPISTKNSRLICSRINGMQVSSAKRFLNGLVEQREDIEGRHYPNAAVQILSVLESAEKNGASRGLGSLKIFTITAEAGPHRMRRKRKGGRLMKLTHVKVVLEGKKEEKKPEPKKETKAEKHDHTHEEKPAKAEGDKK